MSGDQVNGVTIGGGSVTDPDAIHRNVAGEILAVVEKAVPIGNDLVLSEDSAAAHAKKGVKVNNIYYDGGYF